MQRLEPRQHLLSKDLQRKLQGFRPLQHIDVGQRPGVDCRFLATLVVEETEPAVTQDAYGGVAATNAALRRALERTVAFVLGEAAAVRPTGP